MTISRFVFDDIGFLFPVDKIGWRLLWNRAPPGFIQLFEDTQRLKQRLISFDGLKGKGRDQFFGILAQLGIAVYQQFDGIHLSRCSKLLRFVDGRYKTLPGKNGFNGLGILCGFFRGNERFPNAGIEPNFLMDGFPTLLEVIFLLLLSSLALLVQQFVVHIERLVDQFFFGSQQEGNQRGITVRIVELVESLGHHTFALSKECQKKKPSLEGVRGVTFDIIALSLDISLDINKDQIVME